MDGINEAASFFQMSGLDHAKSELLNCIRDGTSFLNSVKAKYDQEVSPLCACGLAEDSIEHRALACPRFKEIRQRYADVERMWFSLPVCMTHHGLSPANPWQTQFWAMLNAISWDAPEWVGGRPPSGRQLLFTDGSCSDSSHFLGAVGGWSLVSANLGCVVGAGLQPTMMHTSDRCEVWAIAMALCWLSHWKCDDAVVHTDSQYALDGCQILQQCRSIPANWCNQDLWEYVLQCLSLYDGIFTVKKVAAHKKLSDASSSVDAFCTFWNSVAGKSAKTARLSGFSCSQNEVFHAFHNSNIWQSFWSRRCQEFLLALAVRAVGSPDGLEDQELPDLTGETEEAIFGVNDGALIDAMPLDWKAALASTPKIVEFGTATASAFVQWILDQALSAQYVRQLTFLELFIGFHFEVGMVLPIQVGVRRGSFRWLPVENSNAGALLGRTLDRRLV